MSYGGCFSRQNKKCDGSSIFSIHTYISSCVRCKVKILTHRTINENTVNRTTTSPHSVDILLWRMSIIIPNSCPNSQ